MTFNIRKSSTYDSKPGSLRLRKDGLGGNLFLREKFPGEDVFPPYTPELVTNGLIYHLELTDSNYLPPPPEGGTFKNLVDTNRFVKSQIIPTTSVGNIKKIQGGNYLTFDTFPANFPLGDSSITISMCFMSSIDIIANTFLFFAVGAYGESLTGEILIRINSNGYIEAGPVDNLLVSSVPILKNKVYSITLSHLAGFLGTNILRVRELLPSLSPTGTIDTGTATWDTQNNNGAGGNSPIYVAGTTNLSYAPAIEGQNFTGYMGAMLIYDRFLLESENSINDNYFSGLYSQFP